MFTFTRILLSGQETEKVHLNNRLGVEEHVASVINRVQRFRLVNDATGQSKVFDFNGGQFVEIQL
jgi:hypothetical protein